MRKTVTTRYDVADHLRTPKEMAAYLEACLEEAGGDAAFIAKALGDIARAKGMAQVARDAGLSRESLYKGLASVSGYDAGGYVVNFGPEKRHGSNFVELAVISKTGQFRF